MMANDIDKKYGHIFVSLDWLIKALKQAEEINPSIELIISRNPVTEEVVDEETGFIERRYLPAQWVAVKFHCSFKIKT